MSSALSTLPITELRTLLAERRCSAVELLTELRSEVERRNPRLNAYVTLTWEEAFLQARDFDSGKNREGLLAGVPIAIKDNILTEGARTTAGSRMLERYRPPYSATAVERLKEHGAILVGKTNCDDFAMGSSTETSIFGPTRNPWNPEYIPGGSSGGSASAVAARLAFGALGTDTGGSIRQPASHCGLVGLKPTYGRVSRYGVIAFASSLDQIGPFARTVEDAALLFEAMAGHDPRDSTSINAPAPNVRRTLSEPLSGLRIGFPKEYFGYGIDAEVSARIQDAIEVLKKQGAIVKEISLPHSSYAIAVYYVIATAEASANLARYDGIHYGHRARGARSLSDLYTQSRTEGFGTEVRRRILLGTFALSSGYYDAYYGKAQTVRALIRKDFSDAFQQCDVILSPAAPTPAFRLGEKTKDPIQMYLSDIFTVSANLSGFGALVVPCGFTSNRLPVGFQLFGRPLDEARLFNVAHQYERVCPWHREAPNG